MSVQARGKSGFELQVVEASASFSRVRALLGIASAASTPASLAALACVVSSRPVLLAAWGDAKSAEYGYSAEAILNALSAGTSGGTMLKGDGRRRSTLSMLVDAEKAVSALQGLPRMNNDPEDLQAIRLDMDRIARELVERLPLARHDGGWKWRGQSKGGEQQRRVGGRCELATRGSCPTLIPTLRPVVV